MNEIEILNMDAGGVKVKEMTAFSFLSWVANKINNRSAFSADMVELTLLVKNPPMSRTMRDDAKLDIIKKMMRVGITFP